MLSPTSNAYVHLMASGMVIVQIKVNCAGRSKTEGTARVGSSSGSITAYTANSRSSFGDPCLRTKCTGFSTNAQYFGLIRPVLPVVRNCALRMISLPVVFRSSILYTLRVFSALNSINTTNTSYTHLNRRVEYTRSPYQHLFRNADVYPLPPSCIPRAWFRWHPLDKTTLHTEV